MAGLLLVATGLIFAAESVASLPGVVVLGAFVALGVVIVYAAATVSLHTAARIAWELFWS